MDGPVEGFGPGQPSRTSLMVAAARAFGAREPDPSIRNPDYLAEQFLGPAERQLIHEHPLAGALDQEYDKARQNPAVAGPSNMMLVRTRFIDEHLRRAISNGAAQVVILGAGFDTRAYRFQELLSGRKVFEVDYHSTQAAKKRRVGEVLGGTPSNLTFVEMDFQRDELIDVLRGSGFDTTKKTVWIWEGVSMYLPESAARATLRTIAGSCPPGSSLVMDFAGRATIDLLQKVPDNPMHRFTTAWGEPWIFGLPDGREKEFFNECGLELRELMKLFGSAVRKRYLTRADGKPLGAVRRPRAPQPGGKRTIAKRLFTLSRIVWIFLGGLRRNSKWYAIAELTVPARSRI